MKSFCLLLEYLYVVRTYFIDVFFHNVFIIDLLSRINLFNKRND